MHIYKGAGVMPEVPGVPMRDLTDDEFKAFGAMHGKGALLGVYESDKSEQKKTKAAKPDQETD